MKNILIAIAVVLVSLSCTKENSDENSHESTILTSEFEALKQEVEQLKVQVASIAPSEPLDVVTVEEFNELKQENEQLKAQIALFTSGFFEVDGLRFDRNGTLISVQKRESIESRKVGNQTLTTTRTYDDEGRVIDIYNEYSGGSSIERGIPYYWQRTMYEYVGKKCITTTRKNYSGMSVTIPYEEEVSEAVYW